MLFFKPKPNEHHIALTEVSQEGTELGETKYFTLKNGTTLEFGPEGPDELRYDVGSKAFLYCDKKNIMYFADPDDDEGQILELPETLKLSQGEDDDEVRVRCEIVDDSPDEDDTPIFATDSDDKDPLDI